MEKSISFMHSRAFFELEMIIYTLSNDHLHQQSYKGGKVCWEQLTLLDLSQNENLCHAFIYKWGNPTKKSSFQ